MCVFFTLKIMYLNTYFFFLIFFQYWLDTEKQLNHQVGLSTHEPLLKFCVKFYTPDPSLIEEEYTRYLFGLQIKRDLAMGQLQCNDNTAALMASYIVQGKIKSLIPLTYLHDIGGKPTNVIKVGEGNQGLYTNQ